MSANTNCYASAVCMLVFTHTDQCLECADCWGSHAARSKWKELIAKPGNDLAAFGSHMRFFESRSDFIETKGAVMEATLFAPRGHACIPKGLSEVFAMSGSD